MKKVAFIFAALLVLGGCKAVQPDASSTEQAATPIEWPPTGICVAEYSHAVDFPTKDMGDGLVLKLSNSFGFSGGDTVSSSVSSVRDCSSGREISLFRREEDSRDNIDYDRGARVDALLASSENKGTASERLSYLISEAGEQGIRVAEDHPSNRQYETCGCKAFYPELRGNKKPYPGQVQ